MGDGLHPLTLALGDQVTKYFVSKGYSPKPNSSFL